MAIEQERAAEAIEQLAKQRLNGFVIGAVRLAETLIELLWRDRATPEVSMLLCAGRDDAESASCAGADPPPAGTIDNRGIDVVFRPVAVNCGSRRSSNHAAAAALQCTPDQPVDQRVLQRAQRRLSCRCHGHEPVRIFAAGMRNGEEDRQVSSRFVDDGRKELAHGLRVNFRASLGLA